MYDPENAGYFLRKNLPPSLLPADFQDLPLWRTLTADMLRYLAQRHPGPLIVPMTLVNRAYYEEIVTSLSQEQNLRHLILCASRETLQKRLASRLEGPRSWAALQMDRCFRAFEEEITERKLHTNGLTIEQAAEMCSLKLSQDRRSGLRKAVNRAILQIRHIQ